MDKLWDLLTGPLGFFILIAVVTSLGRILKSVTEKAAKRADQQQRAERGQAEDRGVQTEERMAWPGSAAEQRPTARARSAQKPAPRDRDEIAAEIRRMMGLEEPPRPAPTPVRHVEPARPEPEEPRVSTEPKGQTLRQRMAVKAREHAARHNLIEDRHVADGHDILSRQVTEMGPRQIGRLLPSSGTRHRAVKRQRRHILDISNPAAVIVAAEVLGKPIALRGPDSFG